MDDAALRRAGMDYLDQVTLTRHVSWAAFEQWRRSETYDLALFTTAAATSYLDHRYRADTVLLFGRESAGVPEPVHSAADARLTIPMRPGLRSLNVAVAAVAGPSPGIPADPPFRVRVRRVRTGWPNAGGRAGPKALCTCMVASW